LNFGKNTKKKMGFLMRKKIEWEWERLDESTWRAKTIGGWVLKSEYVANKMPATTSVFVSDRDHEWIIAPSIAEIQAKEKLAKDSLAKDYEPVK